MAKSMKDAFRRQYNDWYDGLTTREKELHDINLKQRISAAESYAASNAEKRARREMRGEYGMFVDGVKVGRRALVVTLAVMVMIQAHIVYRISRIETLDPSAIVVGDHIDMSDIQQGWAVIGPELPMPHDLGDVECSFDLWPEGTTEEPQ